MLKKLYFMSFLFLLALAACNKENDSLYEVDNLPVSFNSSVFEEIETRVTNDKWDNGDKIGVFAIKSETSLEETSVIYDNFSFSTTGDGKFFHDNQPIYYPEDGSAIDFISYYPYKEELISYTYPIDINNQEEFLYSNNVINASRTNTSNHLVFNRPLSKLSLFVESKSGGSLDGLAIEINGIKTKADFSLADGTFTIDDTSDGNLLLTLSGSETSKNISCFLLPATEENSIEVVFKLNNSAVYKWVVPHALEQGKYYNYKLRLNDGEGESGVEAATSYMEIPYYTNGGKAPNVLLAQHMVGNVNWLNNYSGPNTAPNTQRNYTILYDTKNFIPLCIAYPMHSIYMKSGNRTDAWDLKDPIIPVEFQTDNSGWSDGTYNRGHMLASADRSATRDINRTTFYPTNMVPQNTNMNGNQWNNLEQALRSWVEDTRYDTTYVVTGSILPPEAQINYTYSNGKKVAIPDYMYKALLRQNKSSGEWHSIAFKMENSSNSATYQKSVVSVAELEVETGFTFFPNLEDATEVKQQKNLSFWNY